MALPFNKDIFAVKYRLKATLIGRYYAIIFFQNERFHEREKRVKFLFKLFSFNLFHFEPVLN